MWVGVAIWWACDAMVRCRANVARIRQPRPDYGRGPGLGVQVKVLKTFDRLRVGLLTGFSFMGGVPREQKMLKGHLPRIIYHQVY